MLGARAWDAGLSGAAGWVAMHSARGEPLPSRAAFREALLRAGWPYGADQLRRWTVPAGGAPPADLLAWLEALPPDPGALGLARARGARGDVWVATLAVVPAPFPPLKKRWTLGDRLELPSLPGGTWQACDPEGRLATGALDGAPLSLETDGEWLFTLTMGSAALATLTLYVDLDPTHDPLLGNPPDGLALDAATSWQVNRVRDAFGLSPAPRDPFLDAAAQAWLADPSRPLDQLTRGWPQNGLSGWRCTGEDLHACVDQRVWQPEGRSTLIGPVRAVAGIAAVAGPNGVTAAVILGPEPEPLAPRAE